MAAAKGQLTQDLERHFEHHPVAVLVTDKLSLSTKFQQTAINMGKTTRSTKLDNEWFIMAMDPDWYTDWLKEMADEWTFDARENDG